MIEVTNKTKSPVQLVVRSKEAPKAFTTLTIAGIGANKNLVLLEDEVVISDIIERLQKLKMISTRYISNKELKKGD